MRNSGFLIIVAASQLIACYPEVGQTRKDVLRHPVAQGQSEKDYDVDKMSPYIESN